MLCFGRHRRLSRHCKSGSNMGPRLMGRRDPDTLSTRSEVTYGHETPYSIKYNQAREMSRSRSANDLDNMTALDLDTIVENISVSGSKCEFYLKQKQSPRNGQFEDSPHHKPMKKHKKTQNIFNTIFRKKRVFGIPLAKICDKNLDPPEGIIKLMVQVYQHGPQTSGILRRGNNALLGKEIKEKINAGDKYHLEDHMTPTAASVFKEFLRSIPEGVLVCSLHQQWLCVNKDDPYEEKINKIKTLLAKLPAENFHMLKLTICLLQHLAKHCSVNHMGPSNLATCIAPSLFVQRTNRSSHGKWKGGDVQKQMQESVSEIQEVIVPLISFIITNHIELFGEDILSMFVRYGCQASPPGTLDDRYDGQIQPSADEEEEEEDMSGDEDDDNFSAELTDQHHRVQVHPGKPALMRDSNSGTDSDSMHSVLSMQDGGMGLHHDDSSIDSLGDRDYYSHESPKATKSHLSPSNLSRDSGLTLSDNQLYDEEAYQADIASASAKIYQAKLSNLDPPDLDRCDPGKCRQTSGSQTDKYDSPIPPPRKRSMRRKACIVSSDGERQGFVEYSSLRPPLKHSASTTYLDESPSSAAHKEQRNMVPNLSSIDHRVSDLKEKVQEVTDSPVNVQTMSARTNIGTLIKSASGSRLYLNTDTRPAEFSLQPIEGAAEPPAMRHSSANGHSVPVSPESRHSHSSGDSVISSSIYSSSRDSSINSAPLTPEESSDISLSWIPDINLPGKPWDILLHGTSTAQSLTQTKSSGQSFRNETTSENSCVDTSETLNSPMSFRKSVVAEEVHISRKPHFSLMSDNSTNSSHPLSKNALSLSSIQLGKQRFSAYLDLGSPPPNVILQTLQTSALKDGAGEGALHRRSCVDLAEPRHFHFSKEMQSIIPEEYLHVRSTPVIISPEGESGVAAGATSKAKLSKYIRDKDYVLPLSKQHVDKPLNYEQVQRNFMMKYNEPDDITEKQREISARAKAMYEKSLQLYQKEEIQFSDNQASKTQSVENVTVSSNLAYVKESKPGSEIEDTQSGRLGNLDSTLTAYTSQDSFHSAVMSDDLDDSGASGFLDFGSVSLSLERDIIGGHKHRAESDASLFNRSISAGNLLSISRNESRLSDTDSSGSSTVTVSTLSQLSDSFYSHSDLSNTSSVTISSLTSSDSNPEIHSRSSNRKSARNFDQEFSPVCPRNSSSERINIEMLENEGEDEVGHYTNDIKKDPKEIYLQSKQIYEQNGSHGVSSLVSKGVSSSQDASSVSHGIKPSASSSALPVIRKSLTSHPFVNPPKLQSSLISPVPSSQKTAPVAAAFAGRPAESKARLGLDAPRVNLQRSCSDLSKHANKQGSYSSHSTTVGQDGSADVKENKQSALSTSIHSSNETQPRDVKSEYQQNFMRAKSCFHQAESIKNRHSDTVPYHPVQSPPAARLGKQHMLNPSVTAEPTAANLSAVGKSAANLSAVNLSAVKPSAVKPSGVNLSAATPSAANLSSAITSAASPSALSPEATVPHSQTTDSKSQVNKKEFPWSVKVLKSKYDTDQSKDPGNSRNNNESTSQTLTHSHPQSPLPLRNPPSLRQQGSPQHSRSNSSSSSSEQASSCNTSPKTSVSYRHGPQSYPSEASHYSYSSSDDSYGSSPEKRTTWLSGSSFDSEELSDYTNTTYI